mgnify:CR=1 FL=1
MTALYDEVRKILEGEDQPKEPAFYMLRHDCGDFTADPIKNVLQQFVSREGGIVPFPPDLLIVSDTGLNQSMSVTGISNQMAALSGVTLVMGGSPV